MTDRPEPLGALDRLAEAVRIFAPSFTEMHDAMDTIRGRRPMTDRPRNEANVQALAAILNEVMGPYADAVALGFARSIASRGVLVPSAMTREEAERVLD